MPNPFTLEDVGGVNGGAVIRSYLEGIGFTDDGLGRLGVQQAGQYAPNGAPFVPSAGVALVANRGFIVRTVAEKTMTITKIAFVLSVAAGANDNVDVGIYNSTGTVLLGSAGSTAGKLNGALGVVQVNLAAPVKLTQGSVYYAAFSSGTQGGTAASVAMTSVAQGNLPLLFGGAVPSLEQSYKDAQFPLAAPFAAAGGAISNVPILALLQ